AAGTAEEQAKNFQWGLRKSTLNHLICISFTDVAQVANVARNYEILYERDDDDAKDCKKNTAASTSSQADKKPGASSRVFAITEDHANKTS
nr:zinc finger, CCHC-type, retrotransposon Gag domain protein [Tanacetum cinerariifolium]